MNRGELRAYILQQLSELRQQSTLKDELSTTDTLLAINVPQVIVPGDVIVIENETIEAVSYDSESELWTIRRGINSTTPAIHTVGKSATVKGSWINEEIDTYINLGLLSLYPDVWREFKYDMAVNSSQVNYDYSAADPAVGIIIDLLVESDSGVIGSVSNYQHYRSLKKIILGKFLFSGTLYLIYTAPETSITDDATLIEEQWIKYLTYESMGLGLEKRLAKRVKFDYAIQDTELTASTTADSLGSAGYFRYQARMEKRRLTTPIVSRARLNDKFSKNISFYK